MEIFSELRNEIFLNTIYILNHKNDFLCTELQVDEKTRKQSVLAKIKASFQQCYSLNPFNYDLLADATDFAYTLLVETDLGECKIPFIASNIERWWLKNMLLDSRAELFIDAALKDRLLQNLTDVSERSFADYIECYGYEHNELLDEKKILQKKIRLIYQAISDKRNISYKSKKVGNGRKNLAGAPMHIEYSLIKQVFYVSIYSLEEKRPIKVAINDLFELKITTKRKITEQAYLELLEQKKVQEPLILELSDKHQRKAVERCLYLFASYDIKVIQKAAVYELQVKYYKFEAVEVADKILSMGTDLLIKQDPYGKVLQNVRARFV